MTSLASSVSAPGPHFTEDKTLKLNPIQVAQALAEAVEKNQDALAAQHAQSLMGFGQWQVALEFAKNIKDENCKPLPTAANLAKAFTHMNIHEDHELKLKIMELIGLFLTIGVYKHRFLKQVDMHGLNPLHDDVKNALQHLVDSVKKTTCPEMKIRAQYVEGAMKMLSSKDEIPEYLFRTIEALFIFKIANCAHLIQDVQNAKGSSWFTDAMQASLLGQVIEMNADAVGDTTFDKFTQDYFGSFDVTHGLLHKPHKELKQHNILVLTKFCSNTKGPLFEQAASVLIQYTSHHQPDVVYTFAMERTLVLGQKVNSLKCHFFATQLTALSSQEKHSEQQQALATQMQLLKATHAAKEAELAATGRARTGSGDSDDSRGSSGKDSSSSTASSPVSISSQSSGETKLPKLARFLAPCLTLTDGKQIDPQKLHEQIDYSDFNIYPKKDGLTMSFGGFESLVKLAKVLPIAEIDLTAFESLDTIGNLINSVRQMPDLRKITLTNYTQLGGVQNALVLRQALKDTNPRHPAAVVTPVSQKYSQITEAEPLFDEIERVVSDGNFFLATELCIHGIINISKSKEQDCSFCLDHGLSHFKENEHLEIGLESFEKACELNPKSGVARYQLAVALHTLGLIDRALQEIEASLAINPNDGEALETKALILADKN